MIQGFPLRVGLAALFLGCAACASQPMDIAARTPAEIPVSAQEDLRTAIAALRTRQAEAGGWTLGGDGSARGLLGRLVGGTSAQTDTIATYLDEAGTSPASYLAGDIVLAAGLADDVAEAASVVASTRTPLPEALLARDITDVEGVIASMRRARTFFQAVTVDERAGFNSTERVTVSEALTRLDAAIAALSAAADALADRRWAARNQPVS
ncbi:hypothetical protein [Glycocaulis sp.]|uniref:hypothetical protein n=1 Tax=Glycocaulis sp. TaxID=1969725 RepID=UPI0025C4A48C|nr:hypothetical protein [Glycocaulis sp.]MCH8521327.1 hypothetical protein [Glycocaulis sp.]